MIHRRTKIARLPRPIRDQDKIATTPASIRRLRRELRSMFRKLEDAARAERALDAKTQPPPLAPTCT